jgi:5-hydroxyisourate hydrolase
MSRITSHILDTSSGRPAEGVKVILYKHLEQDWEEVGSGATNNDGRIKDLAGEKPALPAGIYKLRFLTGDYFRQTSRASIYPFIEIVFEINAHEHYHIPLLLNPFGYTTYRGS